MFIYYGRNYHSSSIGVRVVEVTCDQCGTRYFYELARVGSGAATAPYAIGSEGAMRSAATGARRDLDKRLNEEAELVPCPNCLWINDHLISGYRRGRYRGGTRVAVGIVIAGTCLTLVTAWASSVGPAGANRDSVAAILTWGLAVTIAIPAVILVVRHGLRQRIQPNRDYPLPPKLPHGSPRALILNPATGELEPAGQPSKKSGEDSGARMDYQIGRSTLPPTCCDCLGPAPPRFAYRHQLSTTLQIVIPLCKRCARRWTRCKWLGALVALVATAAFGVPILLALKPDEIVFWFTIFALFSLLPIVGAMIAGRRAAPVRVESVDISRGVARLWFRNKGYLNEAAVDRLR